MGTIVRRKRIWSRHEIGPYRRHELLTGEIVYSAFNYTGYGDGIGRDLHAFITEEMRADWEMNCDELLAFWKPATSPPPNISLAAYRGYLFGVIRILYRGRPRRLIPWSRAMGPLRCRAAALGLPPVTIAQPK